MIDLLHSCIRNGYSVPEFIHEVSRLVTTERQHQHEDKQNEEEETKELTIDTKATTAKKSDFDLDFE